MKIKSLPWLLLLIAWTAVLPARGAGDEAPPARVRNPLESFSDIARSIGPSIVNIRAENITGSDGGTQPSTGPQHFEEEDPLDTFEKYFGEDPRKAFKQQSLGSGFVIDEKGYIVTNNHVIETAAEIQVRLSDGKEYGAEIVGRDPNTDLALIRVSSPTGLPAVEFGDSDLLEVGQWVVAIGNPFGLEHTVTAGIVSAKGRVIGSGPYDDFIQTDASINPGNSGGPLINLDGKVVGINTAIISNAQGIGFAVPINLAKGIIDQLKQSGEVTRGWLGVAIQDITPEMADYQGIQGKTGVLVTEVFEGDPAALSGIRARDVILSVNGIPVATTRDLTRTIAGIQVGNTARIEAVRDRETRAFEVTIAKRDETAIAARSGGEGRTEDGLGIQVTALTPEIALRLNMAAEGGVIITDIAAESKAEDAGFQAGDVVKEINHDAVATVRDYHDRVAGAAAGETLQFFIRRSGQGFIVIKITK
ncbi:Do family serine endopeptidase [Desulfococcus sp.]|uniref:Do family serine endopeptidase n=1 Tax=Desulfococcus sp. TaxID=2025834 RepID=UPI0035943B6A